MADHNTINGYAPISIGNVQVYQGLKPDQAIKYVYYLLTKVLDRQTAMFISHGKHIIDLFLLIAQYETLEPYSVVMAEEVIGEPFHLESVELEYRESGLIDALSKRGVPFYRILSRSPSLTGTIRIYSNRISDILDRSTNSHIFMEVKEDGGLGGIQPINDEYKYLYEENGAQYTDHVVGYRRDSSREEDLCVSVSLKSLYAMKTVWVFAFGEKQGEHVKRVLKGRSKKPEVSSVSYLQEHPGTVHLFTDQEIV